MLRFRYYFDKWNAIPGRFKYLALCKKCVASSKLWNKQRLGLDVVIFSKDRPMQLEALLRSMSVDSTFLPPIHILYRASGSNFSKAYEEVFIRHKSIIATVVHERAFKSDLLCLLRGLYGGLIVFLVDDIIFTRPIDWCELGQLNGAGAVFSLRLGTQIDYSQTHSCACPPPPWTRQVTSNGRPCLVWKWRNAKVEWGCPHSLDGNVLPLRLVRGLVEDFAYKAPNSLEQGLSKAIFLFPPVMVSYEAPCLINLPVNRVNSEEFNFPHGELTSQELLDAWNSNLQIAVNDFKNFNSSSCHVIKPLRLESRR